MMPGSPPPYLPPTIKELRALAQAATHGPWSLIGWSLDYRGPEKYSEIWWSVTTAPRFCTHPDVDGTDVHPVAKRLHNQWVCGPVTQMTRPEDARFIAAANPETVLSLIDEIEQLRQENARLRDTVTKRL